MDSNELAEYMREKEAQRWGAMDGYARRAEQEYEARVKRFMFWLKCIIYPIAALLGLAGWLVWVAALLCVWIVAFVLVGALPI